MAIVGALPAKYIVAAFALTPTFTIADLIALIAAPCTTASRSAAMALVVILPRKLAVTASAQILSTI